MAHLKKSRLPFGAQEWLEKKNASKKDDRLADVDESQLKASFVDEVRQVFDILDSEHEDTVLFGKVLRALKYALKNCGLRPRTAIKSIKRLQFCPPETKLVWRDFLQVYYVAKSVFDAKIRAEALETDGGDSDSSYYSFHDYLMEFASTELRKAALSDINKGINRFSDLFGTYYMRPFTPPSQLRDMLFMEERDRLSEADIDEDSLPLLQYPGDQKARSYKPTSSTGTFRLKSEKSSAEHIRQRARMRI